ncbi:MAG: NAD(P)-dependent glycerol-3-phosphate dehydrogenase, partial [Lachnospiraceae bacterium]|nr:NAD(P)-dependent glycerol-3-phosphate dehydrogenase [Lachnospiraceae bacterium]
MKKICILGAGSWGTALSILLAGNGHQVSVWSIDPEEVLMLNDYREQRDKLPGVIVPSSIEFTTNMQSAIDGAEIVVCAVPSPFVRSTMKSASEYIVGGTIVVDVAKGIEEHTDKTMTTIIEEECPQARVGILSGPSHAEEVGRRIPTTIVAGSKERAVAETIQDVFMNDVFRVYTSPDVIGIELGGSLKNVIALAAGMVDGLGFGDNTKAALMTRGIAEMSRLVIAMGGHMETLAGLSGIGDLIVTCTSKHSRNRNAGYLMGQGKTYQEAM